MATFGESTATDWDSQQSETSVHHEQPTGTDWAPADSIEKGYPSSDEGGTSLVLYWPLDEDSGTTANDVSGANDGTVTGATVGNAGGILGSTYYAFDGTDDIVEGPDPSVFPGNATLSIWFRTSTNFGSNHSIITLSEADEGMVRFESDNKIYAYAKDSGGFKSVASNSTLNDGAWHHAAFVINEGTDIELFVDGASQGSTAIGTVSSQSGVIAIGAEHGTDGSTGKFYTGDLDEARVYSRPLSASEVTALYDAAAGTSEYWTDTKTT